MRAKQQVIINKGSKEMVSQADAQKNPKVDEVGAQKQPLISSNNTVSVKSFITALYASFR